MARIRTDFVRGTLTNALSSGDTTMTASLLASIPEIVAPDIAVIILDPLASAPEIVHITAHTAAATTATILRGRESSTARAHIAGTAWAHGATGDDFPANAFPATAANGDLLYGVAASDEYVALAKPATPAGEVLIFAAGASAPSWGSPSLSGVLANIRDSKALLCFIDGLGDDAPTTNESVGLGLAYVEDGSGTLAVSGTRGGAMLISTGATGDSQSVITNPVAGSNAGPVYADRNPRASFVLTTQAANAALKVQGFGFVNGYPTLSTWTATTTHKAMFRSVTTGALFAVTGNASNEETTSLSASHTLGTLGTFDVYTEDDGVTWKFAIAGVVVATHTTQVPGVTTDMCTTCGLENNTTTNMAMTVDLMQAYCDRA